MSYLQLDPNDPESAGSQNSASGSVTQNPAAPSAAGLAAQGAGGGGGAAGGAPAGASGNAAGTPGTAAANAKPTSYANLTQYLSANQGSGATTGQAAENVVDQSANAAKSAQATYGADAGSQIAQGAAGTGPSAATQAKIAASGQTVDQGVVSSINAGTTTKAPTTAGYAKDQFDVSYGGPSSTSNLTGQAAADQTAADKANQTEQGYAKSAQGGISGVSGLLQQAYQQPNYSSGENSLDTLLATGTPGGQQALGQAAATDQGVQGNYAALDAQLNGQIAGAKQQAQATNATYNNEINHANETTAQTQQTYANDVTKAQAAIKAKAAAAAQAAQAAQAKANAASAAQPTTPQATGGGGGAPSSNAASGMFSGTQPIIDAVGSELAKGGSSIGNSLKHSAAFAHGGTIPDKKGYESLLKKLER